MRRALPYLLATLVASACFSGCGSGSSSAPQTQGFQQSLPVGTPRFARADQRLFVAHSGVRRLQFEPVSGPRLGFRERITTDGKGHYAVEPLDSLDSPVLDWNGFELMQRAEEGFIFRYRDFVVRDAWQFARTWRTTDLEQTVTVAGRPCDRYRVERALGTPVTFELSVDHAKALVLACRELDENGRLVATMSYESFELEPDTSAVVWHQASNQELSLDTAQDLGQQLGCQALVPHSVPAGYVLRDAATVDDGHGQRWLKITYLDGVEPLFFLQALAGGPKAARVEGVGGVPRSPSSVAVFQVGSATVAQGTVEGFGLIVVGKAPKAELLDLLESALP